MVKGKQEKRAVVLDFEGIDGAGKATQVAKMAEYLRLKGKRVKVFSFPRYKDTTPGKLIAVALQDAENYKFATLEPYAAAFLHFADYAESFGEISRAMGENDYVIFDRYVNSTLFHHGGKLESEERDRFVRFFFRLAHYQLHYPKPDHVIYLDIPVEEALARTKSRAATERRTPDAVETNLKYIADSHRSGLELAREKGWSVSPLFEGERPLSEDDVFERVKTRLNLIPKPRSLHEDM